MQGTLTCIHTHIHKDTHCLQRTTQNNKYAATMKELNESLVVVVFLKKKKTEKAVRCHKLLAFSQVLAVTDL